jgi:hypothetical protein
VLGLEWNTSACVNEQTTQPLLSEISAEDGLSVTNKPFAGGRMLAALPVDGWLVLKLVLLDHVGVVLVVQVDQAPGHHPHILQAGPAINIIHF